MGREDGTSDGEGDGAHGGVVDDAPGGRGRGVGGGGGLAGEGRATASACASDNHCTTLGGGGRQGISPTVYVVGWGLSFPTTS